MKKPVKKLAKKQTGGDFGRTTEPQMVRSRENSSVNIPKESFGSKKVKTVSVSPDRNYKTIVKEKMGPEGSSTTVTNRRTVKGALSGAPKAGMMKKGGSMKASTIKKKK